MKPEAHDGLPFTAPEAKNYHKTHAFHCGAGKTSYSSPSGSLFPFPSENNNNHNNNSPSTTVPGSAGLFLQSSGSGAGVGPTHLFSDLPDNPDNKSGSCFADVIRNLSEYSSNEAGRLSVLDSYYLSSIHAAAADVSRGTDTAPTGLHGSLLQYTPDSSPNVGCGSSTSTGSLERSSHLQGSVPCGGTLRSVLLSSCKPDQPKCLPSISEFGIAL